MQEVSMQKNTTEDVHEINDKEEKHNADEVAEIARIRSLPHTLRVIAENEALGNPPEDFKHFVPLFSATFPSEACRDSANLNGETSVHAPNNLPNVKPFGGEKWVLNVQLSLAFGTSDLHLSEYPQIERRPVTEHERLRMWSVLSPVLCENLVWSTKSIEERKTSRIEERDKFLKMSPVFWVKFSDILFMISSEPRYAPLYQHPLTTVEVAMDIPTLAHGSPGFYNTPNVDVMAERIQRRFSMHDINNPENSPCASLKGSSYNLNSKSMPPPSSGINNFMG